MFWILSLVKSKVFWIGLAVLSVFLLIKSFAVMIENLREDIALRDANIAELSATVATSETLRAECNVNIRQRNSEIEIHAAISELEQIEREELMEEINVHRRSRISRTQEVRTQTQVALAGLDCSSTDLPLDVIRLSDITRAAANQHSAD